MGKTQFNFSMPPETYYAPVRSIGSSAVHRKRRSHTVAIALTSMLGGALATSAVAFALLPAVAGVNVVEAFGDVPKANATQQESQQTTAQKAVEATVSPAVAKVAPTNEQATVAQTDLVKSPYPVHRKAAAQTSLKPASNEQSEDEGAVEEDNDAVWVEGWTETIVHPAVYEDIPSYESYLCEECGYESIDSSDIIAHIEEHENATYLTVENDCPEVVLEDEWTETIYHEGYWS